MAIIHANYHSKRQLSSSALLSYMWLCETLPWDLSCIFPPNFLGGSTGKTSDEHENHSALECLLIWKLTWYDTHNGSANPSNNFTCAPNELGCIVSGHAFLTLHLNMYQLQVITFSLADSIE